MPIGAHAAGVRAAFFARNETYGSRALRRTCRTLGLGYAVAVRTDHRVALTGKTVTCKDALELLPERAAIATALECAGHADDGAGRKPIPLTCP